MIRLRCNAHGDAKTNTKKCKATLSRCEASVLFKNDRKGSEEGIERAIHNGYVNGKQKYNGFGYNEHLWAIDQVTCGLMGSSWGNVQKGLLRLRRMIFRNE